MMLHVNNFYTKCKQYEVLTAISQQAAGQVVAWQVHGYRQNVL